MILMQVVLPDPLGPTRPSTSPGMRWKLAPSSAQKPPKRLTTLSTRSRGVFSAHLSGDIDPPPLKEREQPIGQERNQSHDQRAIDKLKILWRRDADAIVDPVEYRDSADGADDRGSSAEQGKYYREDAHAEVEDRFRIEHGYVPSVNSTD